MNRLHKVLGTLRSDDGDGNEDVKKENNNFARASRFFVHFFAVTARLRRSQGHQTSIFGKYLFGRRFENQNFRNMHFL